MRFDDRLATVLRIRPQSGAVARVQFRQLVDLLGTMPGNANGTAVDAAFGRLAALSGVIASDVRARIIDEPGVRLRSARLVSFLAQSDAAVACAAVSRAELDEEQWLDLVPALPIAARGVVRHRQDLPARVEDLLERLGIAARALPPVAVPVDVAEPAAASEQPTPAPAPPPVAADPPPRRAPESPRGIGDIVRRIEAFRRAREPRPAPLSSADAPPLPLGGDDFTVRAPSRVGAFDFTCDPDGRIAWAEGTAAPMVVGHRLSAAEQAIRRRQPIRALVLELAGAPAICGQWHVDAVPMFDPQTGRFTGYQGRFRRPAEPHPPAPTVAEREADRMRQLLHELRTPVNAVQGFAEVIQQQLFGPTPHEYRALAANIVADSARILAGFDELERLAKLECGAIALDPGVTDLAALVQATVAQLEPHTGPRSSGFDLSRPESALAVTMAQEEAERLVWRLLAALASSAAPGERLAIGLTAEAAVAAVALQLPATLAVRTDEDLFHASAPGGTQALSAGMFGTGFTLRLARAEIRAAGGAMERTDDGLLITLPLATEQGEKAAVAAG